MTKTRKTRHHPRLVRGFGEIGTDEIGCSIVTCQICGHVSSEMDDEVDGYMVAVPEWVDDCDDLAIWGHEMHMATHQICEPAVIDVAYRGPNGPVVLCPDCPRVVEVPGSKVGSAVVVPAHEEAGR